MITIIYKYGSVYCLGLMKKMSSASQALYLPLAVSGRAAKAALSHWHSWPCMTALKCQFLRPNSPKSWEHFIQSATAEEYYQGEAAKINPSIMVIKLFEFIGEMRGDPSFSFAIFTFFTCSLLPYFWFIPSFFLLFLPSSLGCLFLPFPLSAQHPDTSPSGSCANLFDLPHPPSASLSRGSTTVYIYICVCLGSLAVA